MAKRIKEELPEKEYHFEICVEDSNVKYSQYGFGTIFTNIGYLLTDKITTSDKNLIEYFNMIPGIYHVNDGEFVYTGLSKVFKDNEDVYQIKLKHA